MALTPDQDKTAFWKKIRSDPWVQKALRIEGQTDAVAATKIRKERTVDDTELNGDVRFILIFDPPSNDIGGTGGLYEQSIIEIDVLMPSAKQPLCDDTLSQIIALCGHGKSVNGRPVAKVVRVGSLTAAAGFYRCGVRIYYYACTITPLKTL